MGSPLNESPEKEWFDEHFKRRPYNKQFIEDWFPYSEDPMWPIFLNEWNILEGAELSRIREEAFAIWPSLPTEVRVRLREMDEMVFKAHERRGGLFRKEAKTVGDIFVIQSAIEWAHKDKRQLLREYNEEARLHGLPKLEFWGPRYVEEAEYAGA